MTRCRHNPPCQRREYWGRGGAGVLFTCSEDGTVLLLLRAAWVEQGGTWGIPGGGIGEGFYRTPMQPLTDMRVFRKKAEEEVEEECGALPPYMTRLPEGLPFTEYEDCGFRYVTFILDITRAQKATWAPFSDDGENDAFVWFPLDAVKKGRPLPDENGDLHDIHFGVTFTMGKLPTANPRRRNPEPTPTDMSSAAFRRWFGASKVVDAQGRPRVVYHGTAYAPGQPYITEFRGPHQPLRYPSFPGGRGKFTGVGSFFSESEEVAASYPYVSLPQTQNYARVVHALYLRIEKPKVYRTLRAASEDMVARAGPDPVAFVALLRAEGYDGITFMEGPSYNPTDAKKKARVWITFSPEQVRYVHPPKAAPPPVVEDDDDDWDDEDFLANPRRATTAERTDPVLWEAVKREVTAGSKGGVPGEWSARKAQLAVALYKKRGGDYIGPKSPQNALAKWTREDWRTRSGQPSLVTGERYLPARAIEALTPAEYAATSRAKRAGLLRDEQFTAQPERIREKTARYRRNPDPLFPAWFEGSVVVMPDGTPRTLWHQTSREAEASILKSGFSVGKVGRWASSKSDTEMPYGVFLKTSPARVWSGLPTGTQMAVVVHAQNPLRVADRAALKLWLHRFPAYRALEDELAAANAAYRAHDGESLRKRQSAWSEWNKTFKRLVPLMRQASTDALVASGHDALWMDNDEGPTSLETLVVLDPRDIRLVSAPDIPIGASRSRKKNPSPREAEAMRAIRVNLTPDLLAGEYRACATSGPMASSPVAGHCAVATEALYFMLGGKAAGYTPMNVRHEGVSHWYLRTPDGRYLDPTADQFDTPVDYASGRGRGFPTPRQGRAEPPPSKRAAVLLSRIR